MALLGSKYKRPSGEEKKNPNNLKVTVLKQVSKNLLPGKFSENRFFLSCIGIGDRYSKSLIIVVEPERSLFEQKKESSPRNISFCGLIGLIMSGHGKFACYKTELRLPWKWLVNSRHDVYIGFTS